ncbi:MAG: hypothetical protein LBF58_00895 [Deltaproteobacteria bacterium]|jgi:hypothetical protein|nr:hypothetical protein [Deltaproteobacteria bacterium]
MKANQKPMGAKNPDGQLSDPPLADPTLADSPLADSPQALGALLAVILSLVTFAVLTLAGPAWGAEPLDLAELGRRGLGERSREIIVSQSLANRGRPPLEIAFVEELAAYGGDPLALAYLEMDAGTADLAESPLPPASMRNMMAAGLSAEELIRFSHSVNPKRAKGDGTAAAATLGGPLVTAMVAGANAERPTEKPLAPEAPAIKPVTDAPAPRRPGLERPGDPRKVPQTLVPGQKADPARPLPEAPGPYWTRAPKGHGTFLGVTESVLADGHRYEVNANARGGRLGQEVLSRPSGHKVVRYFSSAPDKSQAGPAPNDFGSGGEEFYGSPNYYADQPQGEPGWDD